jgi:hypothetical protein
MSGKQIGTTGFNAAVVETDADIVVLDGMP